jgi:hypothetical protein
MLRLKLPASNVVEATERKKENGRTAKHGTRQDKGRSKTKVKKGSKNAKAKKAPRNGKAARVKKKST